MKKQKTLFIFLKIILLVTLVGFIYFQISKIDWNSQSLYLANPLFIVFVLALVPVNWFLEWLKYKLTLQVIGVSASLRTKRDAFLSGIITGMLTPNMLGNFIGRIYYFERRDRIGLIVLTLVGNYAQFIASIFFGLLSLFFLKSLPIELRVNDFFPVIMIVGVLIFLFYFNFEWIFKWMKRKIRIHLLIRNLKRRKVFRWQILVLSFVRHGVFTLQFLFMLHAFGEVISLTNVLWIWQVYLLVTLAPSLFLGKLGIRESISVFVLTYAGMAEKTILISSFLIWVFNLVLPTLLGLFIIKRKK